jgi:hypothetical protein
MRAGLLRIGMCSYKRRYIRYIIDLQVFNPLHDPLQNGDNLSVTPLIVRHLKCNINDNEKRGRFLFFLALKMKSF